MAAYLEIYQSGKLAKRVEAARALLENCRLCPRRCGVNRLSSEKGQCRTAKLALVSSYGPHFGEEAPLVGRGGSGTVFFANCNLKCIFCQNYTISQLGQGDETTARELAEMMLALQNRGCHNINLVSPTHVVPQILEALEIAANLGLKLPLVYNSGGYDACETLEILDGIIDIYMPDMKYSNEKIAEELSGIKDYPLVNRTALKEMHRQVDDLLVDEDGIALRGLLIRHLVLPDGLAGTEATMKFIADEISLNSYVNVMSQYHPCYRAFSVHQLDTRLSNREFAQAVSYALRAGLKRLNRIPEYVINDIVTDDIAEMEVK
jgi:putative pyruvate formate lyase activating enzyme